MPTIEIIGYPQGRADMRKSQIFRTLMKLNPEIIKDTVIVINEKSSVEDMERNRKPFVRVYALNEDSFQKAKLAIVEDEPTDIEFVQMTAFYPAET